MATPHLWDKNHARRWQYIKGGVTLGWVTRSKTGSFYPERVGETGGAYYGPELATLEQAQNWVEQVLP